jgi:CubicO group peptidase (beta-lactamase class C family)
MQKIFVIFICFSTTSFAQRAPRAIDSVIARWGDELVQDSAMRSVSLGIVADKGQWQFHFGPDRPGSNAVYEIGSVTKTFTSLVLAKAVREGKCHWQDDVRKFLPGKFPLMEYAGQPVKLIHLANTSSGLPDNLPGPTMQAFLDTLRQVRPDTIPGVMARHSNVAARVLVLVLERIYGKSIEQLIQEKILVPLGMHETYFAGKLSSHEMPGHDAQGKAAPAFQNPIWNGTGAMRSTVGDMMRYMKMLLDRTSADARTILTPTIAINAATNHVLAVPARDTIDATRYCISMNWFHYHPASDSYRIWTDGGTNGFRSYAVFYPDSGMAMVMLSNRTGPQVMDRLYMLGEKIHKLLLSTRQ